MTTEVDLENWNLSDEEIVGKYICGIEGCSKSYSCRQNCHRHRKYKHKMTSKKGSESSIPGLKDVPNHAVLIREKDHVMESYTTMYERYGEKEAAAFLKDSKRTAEYLIPLRKLIETEISERLADARDSQSKMDAHLKEFEDSFPKNPDDELDPFNAVIKLAKKADPKSISYLKKFATGITSLVDHMSDYSENVNPKFKQCRALKKALDDLFQTEMDRLDLAPKTTPKETREEQEVKKLKHAKEVIKAAEKRKAERKEKRKAEGNKDAEESDRSVSPGALGEFDAADAPSFKSSKKPKGSFSMFLGGLLGSERELIDEEYN
jgi:hypothetical protein